MGEQGERRPVLEWRRSVTGEQWNARVGLAELTVYGTGRGYVFEIEVRLSASAPRHSQLWTDRRQTAMTAQLAAEDAARDAGIAVPANPPKISDGCDLLAAAKRVMGNDREIRTALRVADGEGSIGEAGGREASAALDALRAAVEAAEDAA